MDPLERDGDDGSDAQQISSLCGPVSGGTCAVFGTGEDDECRTVGLVLHCRVVDRHLFAGREVFGDSPFGAGAQQITEADVGEGAARHDAVVAASGSVAVEVEWLHAVGLQEDSGGRTRLDRTGWADVVGRDRIADRQQALRVADSLNRLRRDGHVDEERRLLHVGALLVPLVQWADRPGDLLPFDGTECRVTVLGGEHLGRDRLGHGLFDLLGRRPDVLEIDIVAIFSLAE